MILQLFSALFITTGVYTVCISLLGFPSRRAIKVAMKVSKLSEETKKTDQFMNEVAEIISKIIKIDSYKRKQLDAALKSAGIPITPELFRATSITKAGFLLLFTVPCFFIVPILSVPLVIAALVTYFKDESDINKKLILKREQIEYELPRFASTIKQELKITHDVLGILERYNVSSGEALKKELDITIADMKSANYEAALIRLEARVNSGNLSDIIRGLVGVIRGDDNKSYFEMLSHDLDVLEIQRLEDIAAKQPEKLKKYQFLMFACILLIYIVVIGVYAVIMISNGGI